MNDKELAGKILNLLTSPTYWDSYLPSPLTDADRFVRDWRVAGVMLTIAESELSADDLFAILSGLIVVAHMSDPRAIIEACVEALT